MVIVVPEPVVMVPPGDLVNVQPPMEGKLFSTTLPNDSVQVGWVRVPTIGAVGVAGCVLIVIGVEEDMQVLSDTLLTVTL